MRDAKPLSIRDAAMMLGCTVNTLRRWTDDGLIGHYRTPGGQRRYHPDDLLEFMDASYVDARGHGTTSARS